MTDLRGAGIEDVLTVSGILLSILSPGLIQKLFNNKCITLSLNESLVLINRFI